MSVRAAGEVVSVRVAGEVVSVGAAGGVVSVGAAGEVVSTHANTYEVQIEWFNVYTYAVLMHQNNISMCTGHIHNI